MKIYIAAASIALIAALGTFPAHAQDMQNITDYGQSDTMYSQRGMSYGRDGVVEDTNTKLPPGMVMKKVGGSNVIVPQDAWVQKQGGMLTMEDPTDYTARKVMEIEKHLSAIDADLEDIHNELQALKNSDQKK